MISSIIYNNEQRSFSTININPKLINRFNLKWPFRGRLTKDIYPFAVITCYKFTPLPSIYDLPDEFKKRELELMNGLKKLCPEVTVIRARRLNNALYIGGLDEYKDKYTETDWRVTCRELGVDYNELMQKLGPHLIFLGDSFANAVVLAHEFGHYLNTVGRGEVGGAEAHSKYKKASKRASLAIKIGLGSNIALLISALMLSNKSIMWSGGIAAISELSIPLLARPIIKSETVASITAIKLLKKVGADEDEVANYRNSLDEALGTYKEAYVKNSLISGSLNGISAGLAYLTK